MRNFLVNLFVIPLTVIINDNISNGKLNFSPYNNHKNVIEELLESDYMDRHYGRRGKDTISDLDILKTMECFGMSYMHLDRSFCGYYADTTFVTGIDFMKNIHLRNGVVDYTEFDVALDCACGHGDEHIFLSTHYQKPGGFRSNFKNNDIFWLSPRPFIEDSLEDMESTLEVFFKLNPEQKRLNPNRFGILETVEGSIVTAYACYYDSSALEVICDNILVPNIDSRSHMSYRRYESFEKVDTNEDND